MRREWTAWIKTRQWNEFEKLAKTEPSQPLADTVAELERGFPDKADRRSLRKVLYLLAQAGYRPDPIEEQPEPAAASAVASTPLEMGYLASTNGAGETMVAYGCESGKVFRWLVTELDNQYGVVQASEREVPIERIGERLAAFRKLEAAGMTGAEVPAAFARARIAEVVSRSKGLPPTIAYWRSTLEGAQPVPHPAESIPRDPDVAEGKDLLWAFDETVTWRLELGSAAVLLDEFRRVQDLEGLDDEAFRSRVEDIKAKMRGEIVTHKVIDDHMTRLLDLAYLFHLRGKPGVGRLLTAADDLRARGAESDYAVALLEKTLMLYVTELRESRRGESS